MIRAEKTISYSFLKIVPYMTKVFLDLNNARPCYDGKDVEVISITPIGTDKDGSPLFCYELNYK